MPVPTPAPPSGPTHPGRTLPSPAPCDSSRQQIQIMLHRLLYPDPLIQGELRLHSAHATALDRQSSQPRVHWLHYPDHVTPLDNLLSSSFKKNSTITQSRNTQALGKYTRKSRFQDDVARCVSHPNPGNRTVPVPRQNQIS